MSASLAPDNSYDQSWYGRSEIEDHSIHQAQVFLKIARKSRYCQSVSNIMF
jgi:hypothetical protein